MTNESSSQNQNVTVLGLGRMGTAIAAALLAAGRHTTVWNRSPGRGDELVERGAVRAATAGAAAAAGSLVIAVLSDHAAVRQTLALAPEAYAGRTLVNLTTGTPDEARELASWAADSGVHYLDGAMMAVPQTVATPDAFFLYSGSGAAFERHRETLDALASSHYLGAEPEMAELWDAALLGTGYATLAGFLHGVALLDTAAIKPSQFVPLASRWLHGMIEFMAELAREAESGEYAAGVSPVDMNREAVAKLVRTSMRRGVEADVHAPLRALLDRRSADGHGADSFASLFEVLRRP